MNKLQFSAIHRLNNRCHTCPGISGFWRTGVVNVPFFCILKLNPCVPYRVLIIRKNAKISKIPSRLKGFNVIKKHIFSISKNIFLKVDFIFSVFFWSFNLSSPSFGWKYKKKKILTTSFIFVFNGTFHIKRDWYLKF